MARRPLPSSDPPPFIPWDEFLDAWSWRQGEHVSMIGHTGSGKTTVGLELLRARSDVPPQRWHSLILATKPADDTLARFRRVNRWPVLRSWPPPRPMRLAMLWPKWRTIKDHAAQRAVFEAAFADVFASGSVAVFADEVAYLCRELKLDAWLRSFWQQGRSLNLTLIAATQRPAWVPRDLYTEATHVFLWRTRDDTDLRTIGGIGGTDAATIRATVAELPHHGVLYVNSRTGRMARTLPEV